ncbi:50S ribosomal protein L21 [bacterium]|nr:50S ribosomal protein L21 [bacterium]
MFAVIENGGKQYRVEPEQIIQVEKLVGQEGEKVVLDRVLLLQSDSGVLVGNPLVKGASVEGQIINHTLADKIMVFKKKKRKGYHKKQGHRQQLTNLKITGINS